MFYMECRNEVACRNSNVGTHDHVMTAPMFLPQNGREEGYVQPS